VAETEIVETQGRGKGLEGRKVENETHLLPLLPSLIRITNHPLQSLHTQPTNRLFLLHLEPPFDEHLFFARVGETELDLGFHFGGAGDLKGWMSEG
jgi:hypothetical protein